MVCAGIGSFGQKVDDGYNFTMILTGNSLVKKLSNVKAVQSTGDSSDLRLKIKRSFFLQKCESGDLFT